MYGMLTVKLRPFLLPVSHGLTQRTGFVWSLLLLGGATFRPGYLQYAAMSRSRGTDLVWNKKLSFQWMSLVLFFILIVSSVSVIAPDTTRDSGLP
jgi:hypothetical protein